MPNDMRIDNAQRTLVQADQNLAMWREDINRIRSLQDKNADLCAVLHNLYTLASPFHRETDQAWLTMKAEYERVMNKDKENTDNAT